MPLTALSGPRGRVADRPPSPRRAARGIIDLPWQSCPTSESCSAVCGAPSGRSDDRLVRGRVRGPRPPPRRRPDGLRLAFVVLTLANGVGVLAYVVPGRLLPAEATERAGERPAELRPTADRERRRRRDDHARRAARSWAASACSCPAGLVWSVASSAAGFALVWARTSDEGRERWMGLARGRTSAPVDTVLPRPGAWSCGRSPAGTLLVVGLALLFASGGLLSARGPARARRARHRRRRGPAARPVDRAPAGATSTASAASASAPRSAPRWPPTCTTRCCRR